MKVTLEKGLKPCLVLLALVALVALVAIVGCSTTPVPYRYYMLQPLAGKADTIAEDSLVVSPVTVPDWLDRTNLIYSDGNFRLEQLPLDRWGEPLADAITRTVTQNLRRQNPGVDVIQGPWLRSAQPEMMIELEVLNLVLKEDKLILEVNWSLTGKTGREKTGISMMQLDMAPLVEAIDLVRSFSLLLSDLTRDLQQQLLVRP